MAVRIKSQKDYYETEATISLPADVGEVDSLLRAIRTSGKMVVVYYDGSIQGVNITQKTPLTEGKSEKVKNFIGLDEKIL